MAPAPDSTIGAALALKGSGRLPVAIMGDGDFLMGVTALWTAAHYALPCVMHRREQPLVLQRRGAPGARRARRAAGRSRTSGSASASTTRTSTSRPWRARKVPTAFGPVTDAGELRAAIAQALAAAAEAGAVAVVDVRVLPGYDANPSGPASHQR